MKKLLNLDELSEGPLTRYIRYIYAMSKMSQPFDEFKKEWEDNYDRECKQRNIDHPVEINETVRLDRYKTVTFFKRKGEEWLCSECDMAPNGGSGNISLAEAKAMVKNSSEYEKVRHYR